MKQEQINKLTPNGRKQVLKIYKRLNEINLELKDINEMIEVVESSKWK